MFVFYVYYTLELKEGVYLFWLVSYHTIFHSMKRIFSNTSWNWRHFAILLQYSFTLVSSTTLTIEYNRHGIRKVHSDNYHENRNGKFYLAHWAFVDMIYIIYDSYHFQLLFAPYDVCFKSLIWFSILKWLRKSRIIRV